jgi:hypothetical protein
MTIKVIIKNILKKNKKNPTIHTKKTKQTKTKQVKKNQVIKRISEYILSIKIGNEISIFRRLYDILCFLWLSDEYLVILYNILKLAV